MDSERWERVQALFHAAVDRPAAERQAFVHAACAGDETLVAEVLALIDEDQRGMSVLDADPAAPIGALLDRHPAGLREIGPYRLLRVLGEGGMGTVFLAARTDLGSHAAVKVLRDAWLSSSRRERFATEQRALAILNHPSIARLYDAGALSDGTPWIVMEYVDGVPLTEYCRTRASSVAGRLRLFADVCAAVQHAHGHLILHRDLKPSNILVTADGRVKLVDFGISKQLGAGGGPVDQTRTGARLMTPAYAAPEQIRGERLGAHTDVYGLGVVLYELLTGRLPFETASSARSETERLILEREPPKPSVIARVRPLSPIAAEPRSLRSDLDVLCLTALRKDPAWRYGSVEALGRDVAHYLQGEPLEARSGAFAYRTSKFVRRHWRAVAAAAAMLLVTAALVTFYTLRLAAARNAAVAEAARTQRIQALMLNLFTGGEELAGPADDLRVVTLLDRGVLEAQSLSADPQVQSLMFRTLGGIYQKLGDLSRADALLDMALRQRRGLDRSASLDAAEVLIATGLLRVDQARFDEAEQLVREGLATIRRHAPPEDPAVARGSTALGRVLYERGAYAEAIAALEEAVRLHESSSPASADLSAALTELVNAHFYAGHLETADEVGRRALAMTRQLNGPAHGLVAEDLINLGAIQHERGHYAEAERHYREALAIVERWYGADHFKTASALTMLGRSLQMQKRLDEAGMVLSRAVAIQTRVFGAEHPRVASAVNDLGSVALQRGELGEAETAFARMAAIYRRVHGERHYLVGIALSNLASVHVARHDYVRAEPLYRQAIALFAETQSPQHLNTGIGRVKLGRVLVNQGRYSAAESELLTGYEILKSQASPSVSWIRSAREDLVKLYTASGRADRARAFREEQDSGGAAARP